VAGELAVITGTTHGIGRVTALEMARAGCRLVMLCRNEPLARDVAAQIRSATPQARVDVLACDLAHLPTIRRAALVLRERFGPIDRLILNAGIATTSNQRTAAGLDLNFAVNHLGHFLLVELLRDQMAAGGRIITVASRAHFRGRLDLDAVAGPAEKIRATASYARSKLANVLHSLALARQLDGSGVTANCLHPGVVATHLLPPWVQRIQRLVRRQMFDEQRGAQTTLHLALSGNVAPCNGVYFDENAQPRPPSKLAQSVELQDALWHCSRGWVGPG
jgi:NAD(P)-dependent dehydrogenase (short-subunit alcohol dehydrogenase family)